MQRIKAGNIYRAFALALGLLLSACTTMDAEQRRQHSAAMAMEAGWAPLSLPSGQFVLRAFVPQALAQADTLRIYIEGDGLAWVDRYTPSSDPTPLDPLALRLALRDPGGQAVYLARPCQYVKQQNCAVAYWGQRRFAPEVIDASNLAVEQLKRRFHAKHISLVGYSGGGAVALLLAARRKDVTELITVAGNLDTVAWAERHRITPLTGSLNPADAWQALQHVRQIHFVGASDAIVPPELSLSFQARFPPSTRPSVVVIDRFDHHCCWVETWPERLQQTRPSVAPSAPMPRVGQQ